MMPRLERTVRRSLRAADAMMHRVADWKYNPLHQSGTIAAYLLILLTVTGLYLILLYRVGTPAASVQGLAADPWLGGWMRSVHRYSTDLFIVAAVIHALRVFGQARSWGPRGRAWISGVALVGVGLACAWTGFVMAWDSFGQRVALAGARLFDVLPVLSEPVARIFAGDRPVPSAFFFLNLFVHIGLPLAMGVGLWLHVSKVARPVLAPPRPLRWSITLGLIALAVAMPAPLGPAADPLRLPETTPLNLSTAWWVPLAEGRAPLLVWSLALLAVTVAVCVPLLTRRPRVGSFAPSVVDPRLCTGCDQCTQDCPWGAITMVPRTDGRDTLVALVNPALCVSCGICAASCAPMGVGPAGRTGRHQLVDARTALLPRLRDGDPSTRVVAVYCGQTDVALRARLADAGAQLHEVPCIGTLHTSVIELLLRQGASGVFVAGCPPRDCAAREGPKWTDLRMFHDREAELQARVDRRRVRLTTAAAGLASGTVAGFEAFRDAVVALDRPEVEEDIDLRLRCEPLDDAVGVQ
jgi:ferredoxin